MDISTSCNARRAADREERGKKKKRRKYRHDRHRRHRRSSLSSTSSRVSSSDNGGAALTAVDLDDDSLWVERSPATAKDEAQVKPTTTTAAGSVQRAAWMLEVPDGLEGFGSVRPREPTPPPPIDEVSGRTG